MRDEDILFLKTKQPQRKLEIAVCRFLNDGEDPEGRYLAYLKLRFRAALLWILEKGTPGMLSRLLREIPATDEILREGVEIASRRGKTQMTAVLLGAKTHPVPKAAKEVLRGKEAWEENDSKEAEMAKQILQLEKIRLYEKYPYFGNAAAALADHEAEFNAADGDKLYYNPEKLIFLFKEKQVEILLLHLLVHCMYLHILPPAGAKRAQWDQAADIAAAAMLWELGMAEKEVCVAFLEKRGVPMTAEKIYSYLLRHPKEEIPAMSRAWPEDDHGPWYIAEKPCGNMKESDMEDVMMSGGAAESGGASENGPEERKGRDREKLEKKWRRLSEGIASAKKKYGSRGIAGGSKMEWALLKERGRFDFRRYLRRYCVLGEEMQQDPDSLDPIPYCYGLEHFGDMPLIEPLETTEVSKIQELAIAIDTSGSCSAQIVGRFLEEVYTLLTSQEHFFRKMRVHLIQCDSVIQDHQVITSREEWMEKNKKIKISGRGGTDFTPVFSYIESLRKKKMIRHLKGLLYFTDGDGIYPRKATDYETAFVFTDTRFLEYPVPKWAVRLCLTIDEGEM